MISPMTAALSELQFPEQLTRPEIEARQLTRLNSMLEEIGTKNAFWKQRLTAKLTGRPLEHLSELSEFPFLTKQELVNDQKLLPPFGANLTYQQSSYSRLHQTSGTTGNPIRWLDTPESWKSLLEIWAQIYRLVGIRPDDIFAFPFSFGPFLGFWAAFEGAQHQGNLSLTMGGMGSEARIRMILDLNATIICCTPSYALRLADVAEGMGISLCDSAVRMLILAGEPGAAIPAVRQRVESSWGARVIDHWGMTDIGSLGTEAFDTPGELIILESDCIAEIVEKDGTAPVAAGEVGELVITNLWRWGQPVIRYRTGDLVRACKTPCPQGRSLLRLEGGILSRTDDMVTIRGNNVFPTSIDAVIREFTEIVEYRITVVTRRSMPHLVIEIEPASSALPSASVLICRLERTIKDRLNFQAEVIQAESLPRFEMKGRRFFREDRS
ncbi:phenylacetate--CoA ligase family protein [Planctomicrobium sp. SH527]|uniref:phenylacetate--CoA ligase family protein n=1 Tax=Planctomicrobium sp. SH527 TaxID=3448123 RepID=UPI003F5B40EF